MVSVVDQATGVRMTRSFLSFEHDLPVPLRLLKPQIEEEIDIVEKRSAAYWGRERRVISKCYYWAGASSSFSGRLTIAPLAGPSIPHYPVNVLALHDGCVILRAGEKIEYALPPRRTVEFLQKNSIRLQKDIFEMLCVEMRLTLLSLLDNQSRQSAIAASPALMSAHSRRYGLLFDTDELHVCVLWKGDVSPVENIPINHLLADYE